MRRCRSSKMWKWKTPESFDSQSPIRSHIKAATRNLGGLFFCSLKPDDNRSVQGASRRDATAPTRTAQGSSLIPTRSASKAIHSVQSLAGASAWYLPDQLLKANAFCESLRIMSFPVRLDRKTDARAPRRTKPGLVSFPHRARQASDSARRGDRKPRTQRLHTYSRAELRKQSRQRPASRGHPSPRGWQKSCHRREK